MKPQTGIQKSRVFIVDDHPLVREWLANLINYQSDLNVCGEAENATDGLDLIARARPSVAIVDISMAGGSGIELIKNLKKTCPRVAVLVLSMHDDYHHFERAFRAGAKGYITKREATRNVLPAIRTVLAGKCYFGDEMSRMMAEKFVEGSPTTIVSLVGNLSDRELEVFQLLGRGFGTRQIAEELHISFKTVQTFCARIKEKLMLKNATELLREAILWHDNGPVDDLNAGNKVRG